MRGSRHGDCYRCIESTLAIGDSAAPARGGNDLWALRVRGLRCAAPAATRRDSSGVVSGIHTLAPAEFLPREHLCFLASRFVLCASAPSESFRFLHLGPVGVVLVHARRLCCPGGAKARSHGSSEATPVGDEHSLRLIRPGGAAAGVIRPNATMPPPSCRSKKAAPEQLQKHRHPASAIRRFVPAGKAPLSLHGWFS